MAETKTVLLVEDDKFLRELLVQKLSAEKFEIMAAVNGNEVFPLLKQKRPDVMVLDLLLPDMNGFEVLTKMRAEKEFADIPVIILSNLDQKEDVERANTLGVTSYLVKSNFSLSEITDRVKKMLGM